MSGVVVITGAAGGLGQALCRKALKLGLPIAMIGRRKEALKEFKIKLSSDFPESKITFHPTDLVNETAVKKTFSKILSEHNTILALVNNAATWMGTSQLSKTEPKEIMKSVELNFFTAFNASQAVIRLHKIKDKLTIVNIGATASKDSWPEVFPFCAGKGMLWQYSRALAREAGPQGVHIAHLIIDGVLGNSRTIKLNKKLNKNQFISCEAVANDILRVIQQDKSCWTLEWDVRPYNENF